jgi:hypothetical protein
MLIHNGLRDVLSPYRAPVAFSPLSARPEMLCPECHQPLPGIRGPNMVAHPGACIAARKKRTDVRANARRKKRRGKDGGSDLRS